MCVRKFGGKLLTWCTLRYFQTIEFSFLSVFEVLCTWPLLLDNQSVCNDWLVYNQEFTGGGQAA